MRGSGGTSGGTGQFTIGFLLAAVALYLFFDAVRVTTAGHGLVSGALSMGGGAHGMWYSTSTALIFAPFIIGVIALFYDAKPRWAWYLTYFGLAVVAIEIISRLHFFMAMKLPHFLGILVMLSAGVGLMLRSYRPSDDPQNTL